MLIFDKTHCMDVCLKNPNKFVRLAVLDMIGDMKRISKYCISPEIIPQENGNCIIIEENTSDACEPIEDEGFSVKCDGGNIIISAKNYLGTMWGIYTFCERILGVDPCYLFNDLETAKRETLEVEPFSITDKPKGFGFRGVFINDEDLLSGWKDGGGIRYIDFPWYGVTVDPKAIDMAVETILRLKLNLVIPASFLDIDNPPEKALADAVARRGIYLSQHHIEPLGVSHFTFENYCRKKGLTAECSYIRDPEAFEEVWRYYAEKWAEYDNVVWQVGLRGKGDRPVWQDDAPTYEELKDYGKFISNAIARQIDIVLKATNGKAKYFTSTLWMEGARLMNEKLLDIPDDVIIIFADAGTNQMYCKDFYSVERNPELRYGIYYHLQYYGQGPHLAPLTGLDKLYFNIKLPYDMGDRAYSIINASNIREFVFELSAYAQMMWDTEGFSNEKYLDEYCLKYGGSSNAMKGLITEYFDAIAEIDEELFRDRDKKFFDYIFDKTPDGIKSFVLKDGNVLQHGNRVLLNFKKDLDGTLCHEYYKAVKPAIPRYKKVAEGFEAIANAADAPIKKHIEVKWLCYADTMLAIYEWYAYIYEARLAYFEGNSEQMKDLLNKACASLEEYLRYRKCAEYGEFENWYRGDTKMNVKQKLYDTKRLLGHTSDFA